MHFQFFQVFLNIVFNYNIQRMQKHLKSCLSCRQIPQNLFYLSCEHQICVDCARKLVTKQKSEYSIDCPICQEQTCFDSKLYSKLKLQKSRVVISENQPIKILEENSWGRKSNLIHRVDEPFQRYCSDHSQYTVLYVCKTCKNSMVCPECVINGIHKNHEVVSIQKQGEFIKQKMNRQLKILNNKVDELKIIESNRLTKLKLRINELEELKNRAKEQYAQIRESLNREEKAVLSKCNQLLLVHSTEQETFKVEISKEIKNYEEMRASILNILNPFMKQSIVQNCKGLQKVSLINFISQYNKLNIEQQITKEIKKSFENEADLENNIHKIVSRMQKLKLSGLYENMKENEVGFRRNNVGKFNILQESIQVPELLKRQVKTNPNKQPNKNTYFSLY